MNAATACVVTDGPARSAERPPDVFTNGDGFYPVSAPWYSVGRLERGGSDFMVIFEFKHLKLKLVYRTDVNLQMC